MAHTQDSINFAIGSLEILHGRFGSELSDILKRRLGNKIMLNELIEHNNIVGWIMEILYDYRPVGNSRMNNEDNNLTEDEINDIFENNARKLLNK